jgi:hypothetical protein
LPAKFVTRENIHVDRVACPWLIKRFIDPEAELLFVARDDVLATADREGALPYDLPGTEIDLTHHGDQCSFDAFIDRYGLGHDEALLDLAQIVRAADIQAQRETRPEAAGLEAIAAGFRLSGRSDQELLELQFPVYDALYAYCRKKVGTYP